MNLTSRIQEYIECEKLLTPHSRVAVGLSGGADSVALLAILTHLGYECVACHCNFMLRGDESIRDRNHAQHIAQQLGATYTETTFDTTGYASNNGISIEMAARALRYEWFEQVRQEYNCAAIAVAHHRDDNTETVLLNLTRGTGIAGLTGMQPRNGYIIRPLLCTTRNELLQYLNDTKLEYVTDSTNLEAIYTRNKLRLEIIPMLREINPSFDNSIERTIAHLRDNEKFYRSAIEQWRKEVCIERDNTLYIDLATLHTAPAPATLLFEILSPLGFNASQIESMAAGKLPSGKQFITATHRAISHRDNLVVTSNDNDHSNDILAVWQENDTSAHCGLSFSLHDSDNFNIIRNPNVLCLDVDKITYPLILRRWRKGDSFIPFGMKGRKKVSDYFNDHKFSLVEKEKALLLCDNNKIVWIVGERSSNEVRVDATTRKMLVIEYKA